MKQVANKTYDVAKHNWKKILLIVGILAALIISLLVGIKLWKNFMDNQNSKNDKDGNKGGNGSGSGSGASGGSAAGAGSGTSSTAQNPGTLTKGTNLKVGDKIWASETIHMYNNSNLSSGSDALIANNGDYVGQVTQSGVNLKVKLYTYTNHSGKDIGYDFWIPSWKSYYVRA